MERHVFAGFFTAVVSLFIGCGLLADNPETPVDSSDLFEAEIATVGMDYLSQAPIVLLRERETGKSFPIWIGFAEAQAIVQALHGIETPRPLTHDLAVTLMEASGGQMEELWVHDIRDNIFYAIIRLRVPDREEIVEIDSRPSDGLALALRTNAVIRISQKVLDSAPDFQFVPPDPRDQVVQILGMTTVVPSDSQREEFNLGDREGVLITEVSGVALEKGLQRGDLIIGANEATPATPMELLEEILSVPSQEEVQLRYWRDGEEHVIELPAEVDEPEEEEAPTIRI